MSKEWEDGYQAGYDAGYVAASNHYIREQKETLHKAKEIHDPGYHENNFPGLSSTQIPALTVKDIEDRDFEKAYGHALFRSMKKAHEFK